MAELTAHFVADFSSFKAACDAATVKLKSFQQDAGKVTTSLERMAQSLSGNKIISQAELMAQAVEKLGGVSKLTDAELRRIGATVTEASEKMRRMGMTVPPEMQKIEAAAKGIGGSMTSMVGTLTKVAGAFGIAFSVGAVVNFGKKVFDTASNIHDLALKLGISTDAVQGFKFAAEQSGASIDQVGNAINKMNVNLAGGENATVQALKDAELEFAAIRNMKPEDAFLAITDAIAKIEDPMKRADVAAALFGERLGKELLPAIEEGFRKTAEGASKMSEETIESLEEAQDAWERLGNAVTIISGNMINATIKTTEEIMSGWDRFFVFAENVVKLGPAMALSIARANAPVKELNRDIELTDPKPFKRTREEIEALERAAKAAAAEAKRFRDSVEPLRLSIYAFAPSLSNVTEELHDFIGTLDAGALEFRDIYGYMEEVNDQLIVMPKALDSTTQGFREATASVRGLSDSFKSLLSGDFKSVFKDIGNFFKSGVKSIGVGFLESMGEGLLGMLTNLIGKGLSAAWSGLKRLFGGKSENLKLDEQATRDLKAFGQEWINTAGGIEQARLRAAAFGYDLDGILGNKSRKGFENVKTDLGAIDEKWAKLQAAMDKYGISVEELGPKFKQIAQNDWAEQLSSDFAILMEAGAASDAVLLKMKDDVNAFVARSIRMGTEIPDSMIPMLEQMAKMGILTDESGNLITDLESSGLKFSKTMTEAFKGVEDAILALPEAIAKALGVIPKEVRIPVDVEITRRYKGDQEPDVPSFAGGTHGQYVNFGSGTLAMLHNYEKITPRNGGGGDGVGAQTIIVQTYLEGRQVAETVVPFIPGVVKQWGLG